MFLGKLVQIPALFYAAQSKQPLAWLFVGVKGIKYFCIAPPKILPFKDEKSFISFR